MYNIYSNVEDPDGFYGIQNNDVMDSLLRRLDHEGQPLQSLGYNLANVEAMGARGGRFLMSSMRNLHDLGFDRLAGSVLQSSRQALGEAEADPLLLELAWRMSDWDVPLTPDMAATPAGRFYSALRAVHRERDRGVARQVVDGAIRSEMARLQKIGVERMTEVKSATQNLLCLRDIAKWLSEPLQQAVNEGDFASGRLAEFVDLSSSFEYVDAKETVADLQFPTSREAVRDSIVIDPIVPSSREPEYVWRPHVHASGGTRRLGDLMSIAPQPFGSEGARSAGSGQRRHGCQASGRLDTVRTCR